MSKIVIKSGFSAVACPFDNFKSLELGQKLSQAGHIYDITEVREPSKETLVYSKCVPQTNVSNPPWRVEITLNNERIVTQAHCSCPAGLSGHCKHRAALVITLNNHRDESQTDNQQAWRKPSTHGKSLYPKGKRVKEIIKSKSRGPSPSYALPSKKIRAHYMKDLEEFGLANSQIYHELKEESREVQSEAKGSLAIPDWVKNVLSAQHQFVTTAAIHLETLPSKLRQFYQEHVCVDDETTKSIFEATLEQSGSVMWINQRKLRITGSRAHGIFRGRTPHTRAGNFFKSPPEVESIKYGRRMEKAALEQYQLITKREVFRPGLVIKKVQPWLATTPDGLFIDEEGNVGVLEIKSPKS
ncbi:hypothetical protein TCAL_13375, partial [Tigriopus californicus]